MFLDSVLPVSDKKISLIFRDH